MKIHKQSNKVGTLQDEIKLINITLLKPSPLNPRRAIDKEGLQELAESIKKVGVVQPLLLYKRNKYLLDYL